MCKICLEIGPGSPEDALEEELEQAQARVKRLEEALPPAHRLRTLADWIDLKWPLDAKTGHDEVQRDLRIWAESIEAALTEGDTDDGQD